LGRSNTMLKRNRWTLGERHHVIPPLPEGMRGIWGCSLQCTTFDASIGQEVHAVYTEEPDNAAGFANISPLNMLVFHGVVGTPHGAVAYVIWQIAVGTPQQVAIEQYLNPHNIRALRLVSDAADQTHFKLLIVNNQTSEVTAFIDFDNVFRFGELASAMILAIGHEQERDFTAAMKHVMETITVDQLIVLSAKGESSLASDDKPRASYGLDEPLTIVISRDEVEGRVPATSLRALVDCLAPPDRARQLCGKLDVAFHGYDNDRRELFEIPEVRAFVSKLDDEFPFWLFFLTKSGLGLQCIMLCMMPPFLTEAAQRTVHPQRLNDLCNKRWFPAMNHMSEMVGFSEEKINALTEEAIDYFDNGPSGRRWRH
jgi:hypothetical protein